MRLKHLLSVFLTLLTLSVGQMWGAVTPLSLPKAWSATDGKTAYTQALGCTYSLGNDYSASGAYLGFRQTNHYLLIQLADSPDKLGYKIKANPSSGTTSTGQFDVLESANGTDYTTVKSYTLVSNSLKTESDLQLKPDTRYIKFIYTTKTSGNVGLGTISISKAAATCTNTVSLSAGSATNGTISYASSVATCGSGDNDRKVTISVAPSSGYTLLEATRPTFNKTSGTATASYVSGPTWNNSTSKFEYVYRFAKDDKGAGNFSVTCDELPKYKITYNAGTGTCGTSSWTQPSYGAATTLPTATAPTTCSGWTFAGWCTSSAGDAANNTTSPGTILKGSYTPTEDITLYAVYTKSENSSTPTTESYGFESTDDDTNWEFSGVEANTGYHKTGSKAGKIARSSTGNSTITFKNKVNVTAFSFQFMRQTTNNNYNVYIETSTDKSSWSAVETYAMSSFTSAETWYAKSHDLDGKTALYVRIKCYTTSAIRWVDDISITYTGGSTTYYMTSLVCCSPLGSINGSVSLTYFWEYFGPFWTNPKTPLFLVNHFNKSKISFPSSLKC